MTQKVIIIAIAIMTIGIAANEFPADKPCTNEAAFDYYCHICRCEKSGFGAACTKENCGENIFNENGTFTDEYKEMRRRLAEKKKQDIEHPEDVDVPEEVNQGEINKQQKDYSLMNSFKKIYVSAKEAGGKVVKKFEKLWR